ncbi:MAG TPA: alpha/beta fold hydrolase [Pseudonocardiaceae bacterium]|jgi:pimeloyl-ACP methyl ester carboxylesterase|nr:alpha/beta fold hydrolase [Pseudonocardiaceae bacterium]
MTSDVGHVLTSTVEVAGRQVRYATAGTGEPVVLLHGIGRSLEDWTQTQVALSDRYAVYAVDLAGFGRSQPLVTADLPALADHVLATLDQLGVTGPAHLVGNSLGGAVAMRMAVRDRRRVASLTLADSAGFGREVTVALRVLGIPLLGQLLLRPNANRTRMAERSVFHDRAFVTPERLALATELSHRTGGAEAFLQVARSLGTWWGIRPGWRRELLAAVAGYRIPTLIVWGTRDRILPATQLIAAATAFPHARTHLFTETGHMPQIERADEFGALVVDFLAANPARPSITPAGA